MTILRNALTPIQARLTKAWLSRLLILSIMLATVGVGTIAALRLLRTTPPVPFISGQQLAVDIAEAVRSDPTVLIASGTYLPNEAMILYTKRNNADPLQTRTWANRQLEPFLERLSNLPKQEQFTWIIDQAPLQQSMQTNNATVQQEVLSVKFALIADPLQYQYISSILPAPVTAADPSSTGGQLTQVDASTPANTLITESSSPEMAPPAPAEESSTLAPLAQALLASTNDTLQPQTTMGEGIENDSGESQAASTSVPLRAITFTPVAGDDATPSEWRPLSGIWEMRDGIYQQMDQEGYDYIALLDLPAQQHYSMTVRLRMRSGEMGGGLIYNAPNQDSRAGAQTVDMDSSGRYMRWGYYNADGLYTYTGGAALDVGLSDGAWHQLRLVTQGDTSTIWFDEQEIGQTTNQSTVGYVGLVTSRAQIDFDDLVITALPAAQLSADHAENRTEDPLIGSVTVTTTIPTTTAVTLTETDAITTPTVVISETANLSATGIPSTTALFRDDFSAGNLNGWQVLDGTWQFLEESYQQTGPVGSDLATISPFQGSDYRVTVQTRLLAGDMGAGLIFNMAQRNTKNQSQLIRFSNGGRDLQWGAFDEGGNFVLQGSTMIPNSGDGAWHTLTVDVAAGRATFTIDNVTVAKNIALTYATGYLGFFTSNGQVAFDDLLVTPLADLAE